MSRTIELTRGYQAVVDDEDYDRLVALGKWQVNVTGRHVYAIHSLNRGRLYMHRVLIAGVPLVDHINGDGLDNRRSNLRQATPLQNSRNMLPQSALTSSRFKGVARQPRSSIHPWRAYIRINGRYSWLGVFPTQEDAARAYDAAACKHFGEFAHLNFPKETV